MSNAKKNDWRQRLTDLPNKTRKRVREKARLARQEIWESARRAENKLGLAPCEHDAWIGHEHPLQETVSTLGENVLDVEKQSFFALYSLSQETPSSACNHAS